MDSTIAEALGPDDPREVGPFTVIGLLGTGGMGEVYLGAGEEGYVAVKRVRPRLVTGERFKREVGILYRVPAGVAPSVLANDSTAARPWFATEYVPGLTVDEAIRLRGPLPADALWLLLAEVAAQLRAVHEAGIVHRDLKPANVMLVRGGVQLIDFGIARAADQARLTRSGGSYGTRGFTAPEQEDGDLEAASPADVYSLGAMLLYAASGRTPGVVPDVEAMRAVDAELAAVVESCLSPRPEARPAAAALAEAARDHVAPADAWPAEVMERIALRQEFAATPVSRMDTLPPPDAEPETDGAGGADGAGGGIGADGAGGTAGKESGSVRGRRTSSAAGPGTPPTARDATRNSSRPGWKLIALPIAGVVVAGGAAAVLLLPRSSPQPTAHASYTNTGAAALGTVPTGAKSGTSTALPSRSASATASARPDAPAPSPDDTTVQPAGDPTTAAASSAAATGGGAPQPGANPTASAIGGINGSQDTAQVPGSEADTYWVGNDAACSAWLDNGGSGALAAVLNTSLTQSCVAELFRSDGLHYTFSASWGAEKTNFISDVGFTMYICVWHAGDQSTDEVCSPRFGMNGTTPVKR